MVEIRSDQRAVSTVVQEKLESMRQIIAEEVVVLRGKIEPGSDGRVGFDQRLKELSERFDKAEAEIRLERTSELAMSIEELPPLHRCGRQNSTEDRTTNVEVMLFLEA